MRISAARYRLLFKRPFTTAHGTRDGTDAVFVCIEHEGVVGYGEATLPPYLSESADSVEELVRSMRLTHGIGQDDAQALLSEIAAKTPDAPAARNALSMAVLDVLGKVSRQPLWQLWNCAPPPGSSQAMVTLATDRLDDIAERLAELPGSPVLKVKLGTLHDLELIKLIKHLDNRKLLLDANQGLRSVDDAMRILDAAGEDVVAIEQPFARDRWDLHGELQGRTTVSVIGDESIQGLEDLERAAGAFGGVNLKLMKCGGLPEALRMAQTARQLGLKVMLGSMSESSLGCLAMMHLSGLADLVDLDGPWLIRNDPFRGLGLFGEPDWKPLEPGIGAALVSELHFALSAYN